MSKTDVKRGCGITIRREKVLFYREVTGVRGVTSSASQDQRKNLEC